MSRVAIPSHRPRGQSQSQINSNGRLAQFALQELSFHGGWERLPRSIDAVEGAINVLKKQAYDRKQAGFIQSSLIQVRSLKLVPAASKRILTSFLQQAPGLDVEAPEANAYENQSGGVIEMLEKLNDEFNTKKTDLEKEELAAQQGAMAPHGSHFSARIPVFSFQ